jgi:hypothetical protein
MKVNRNIQALAMCVKLVDLTELNKNYSVKTYQ